MCCCAGKPPCNFIELKTRVARSNGELTLTHNIINHWFYSSVYMKLTIQGINTQFTAIRYGFYDIDAMEACSIYMNLALDQYFKANVVHVHN